LYQVIDENAIRVTELPVGLWTEDFKEHLENLIENLSTKPDKDGAIKNKKLPSVKDYKDLSTDITIDIIISFNNGILENLLSTAYDNNCNGLEKLLKLYTTQSMTNMHAFDYQEKLKKYENPKEIIDDYYPIRYTFYQRRKTFQVAEIEKELILLRNRAKYIQEILDNTLELRKKKKDEITTLLKEKNYDIIDDDDEYKYLLKMPMDSVTDENIEKIINTYTSKNAELNIILNKTIEETWIEELDILREEYAKALLPVISAIPSISKMPKKRAVKMKVVK
jgi:DNA topoisomerase-2